MKRKVVSKASKRTEAGGVTMTHQIRQQVFDAILSGQLQPGDKIPSERETMRLSGASRVTVRRAFAELEKAQIIVRRHGVGTLVNDQAIASDGPIEFVAFLSTAHNYFVHWYAEILSKVLRNIGAHMILSLTDLDPEREREVAIDLVGKGIRNLVLWPSGPRLMTDAFPRLRVLGANMVFVDRFVPGPYADYVGLDANHTAETIVSDIVDRGAQNCVLLTHEGTRPDSDRFFEAAFERVCAKTSTPLEIIGMPWEETAQLSRMSDAMRGRNTDSCAFVAINDHVAFSLSEVTDLGSLLCYTIGGSPLLHNMPILRYQAPVLDLATSTVSCLEQQRRRAAKWKASHQFLKGRLVDQHLAEDGDAGL